MCANLLMRLAHISICLMNCYRIHSLPYTHCRFAAIHLFTAPGHLSTFVFWFRTVWGLAWNRNRNWDWDWEWDWICVGVWVNSDIERCGKVESVSKGGQKGRRGSRWQKLAIGAAQLGWLLAELHGHGQDPCWSKDCKSNKISINKNFPLLVVLK